MARQCTCGFTKFYRVTGADAQADVEAWIAVDLGAIAGGDPGEGHGITPHGTVHGAGTEGDIPGDGWSLVRSPYQSRTEEYRCDNCDRLRSSSQTGGTALFGGYYKAAEDVFCFVTNTVADLASFTARVVAQTEAVDFETPVFVDAGPAENAVAVHTVLQSTYSLPPDAAVAEGLFCTGVLGLALADDYDIYLLNSSTGTQEFAGTFTFSP